MITIETKNSGIASRTHDFIVKVDGVEIFRAPTRMQAEFVQAWAARQN